jgi:hypothetical protein
MPGQVWYEHRMLTRSQVARRIGRSIATVRRMEGISLHPDHGPRGTRLFDPEEVEEVAERTAQTGRALDVDAEFMSPSTSSICARPVQSLAHFARQQDASTEVARLNQVVRQVKAEQHRWVSRVEGAVEALIALVTTADDEVLDALDALVDSLRHN